jgi:alpha-amylase/alpha-mannosidase (GH57 family)
LETSLPAAETAAPGVDVLLMWHMHQPDYRDLSTGEFRMPWVYLHALKDYSDMAWHLEQNPQVRVVVNFVPVLLDQLEDYADQFASRHLRDPLLRLLDHDEQVPLTDAQRAFAFDQCFRANQERLISPFPGYRHLHDLYKSVKAQGEDLIAYLSDRYILDLVTWYHLAWTGETVRRGSSVVMRLIGKGSNYTREDRGQLLDEIGSVVAHIIPRYRALAQSGHVEITTTPHNHPLSPLMLDFRATLDALPQAPLPSASFYPGGRERVSRHLDSALRTHWQRFAQTPRGMWPAEGAVSAAFASLMASRGVSWAATSQGVLELSQHVSRVAAKSHGAAPEDVAAGSMHQPWELPTVAPGMLFFFRDDRLSDLIGFVYSGWHGRDAADNLIGELVAIADRASGGPRPLVSIILDGENAWEYYPYNGFFFLSDLYRSLGEHPRIRTFTGSDIVDRAMQGLEQDRVGTLPVLGSGSWVYGNLATWIGSTDKNRAWDLLCAAKMAYDQVMASGQLTEQQRALAQAQLADCEASDWFWWPGDDNPSESVGAFESLFRLKLGNLYRFLALPVPEELMSAFSRGHQGAVEAGGTMKRGSHAAA